MSEKNKYCWDGCYDEKTEWMVIMKLTKPHEYNQGPGTPLRWLVDGPGDANGELVRYSCPKCDSGWWVDDGPRDTQQSRSNRKYPPELEEKYGIDFLWGMEDKDDWTEENCIHCDGKGATKKSRTMINHKNGIEFEVDCKHCEGRGKTTELRLKYCQAKIYDRDSGLSEPCTNEPAKICGGIWCGGPRWVCSRHWDEEAYSRVWDFWDGCCTTCADEHSSFPSGH